MKRVLLVLLAIFALAIALLELAIRSAPLPRSLETPVPATPALEDISGKPFAVIPTGSARDARPGHLKDFGTWLPLATVLIEDRRYFSHPGIDPIATTGAAIQNIANLRIISGASTITQQTIKLASGHPNRSFLSKWQEALSAIRLERCWTKDQILEHYLNTLDYGNRRIGATAASCAYFAKPPSQLTFSEAIYLAGLPQSPSRLNPWKNPQQALNRYKRNISRIVRQGHLPSGLDEKTLLANPPNPSQNTPPLLAPHFARAAIARLTPELAGRRTTLDQGIQDAVGRIVGSSKSHLAEVGAGACAAVVIDNASGGVRAMVSSSGPRFEAWNMAMTPRSAGSTLKPYLYAEAIDSRLATAATLLPDTEEAVREAYADYDPKNYNARFLGPVRLREALGNSLNVPSVVVLSRVGAREAFGRMAEWGLAFRNGFDGYGAGFILGNAEVTLLDLAGAYASLARGGIAWHPVFFSGEPTDPRACSSRAAAAIVTDILCDGDARRISFGNASPLDVTARVAVKTGTSSGFRDGWCVGFTDKHTAAVWAGNPDGSPMDQTLAVRSAAPVWNAIIRMLLERGDPPAPEPDPAIGLEKIGVSKTTGLLPRLGEETVNEWFIAGTAPTKSSSAMFRPIAGKETLVLPREYAAWCAGPQNRLGAIAETGQLEILHPKDGSVFSLNPSLPTGQQVLALASTDPNCEWFADGKKLSSPKFRLVRGEHTLTARSSGQERSAKFRVE